jgi:hypothetical protein
MLIHAYKRKKKHSPEIGGKVWDFCPNAAGDLVCFVGDESAKARFLSLSEAYLAYDNSEAAAEVSQEDHAPNYLVSTGEGAEMVDLRTLTKSQLLAFAAEQEITWLKEAVKVDEYRDALLAALVSGA